MNFVIWRAFRKIVNYHALYVHRSWNYLVLKPVMNPEKTNFLLPLLFDCFCSLKKVQNFDTSVKLQIISRWNSANSKIWYNSKFLAHFWLWYVCDTKNILTFRQKFKDLKMFIYKFLKDIYLLPNKKIPNSYTRSLSLLELSTATFKPVIQAIQYFSNL